LSAEKKMSNVGEWTRDERDRILLDTIVIHYTRQRVVAGRRPRNEQRRNVRTQHERGVGPSHQGRRRLRQRGEEQDRARAIEQDREAFFLQTPSQIQASQPFLSLPWHVTSQSGVDEVTIAFVVKDVAREFPQTNARTCSICLDDFCVGARVRRLPCMHVFHTLCIDKWIREGRRNCPVCRIQLPL